MRLARPQQAVDTTALPVDDTARAVADTLTPPADAPAMAPDVDTVEAPASLVEAVRRALTQTPQAETAPAPPSGIIATTWVWLVDVLRDATGLSAWAAGNLLLTLLVFGGLWLARALVLWGVRRRTRDVRTRYRWRRTSGYVVSTLAAIFLLRVWVGALGSLATFLGLVSAGVAIALRDPLVNLAGWMFIVWKRPFVAGDRIRIRTHIGDVIDQRVFQFTLLEVGTESGAEQSTGRLIHVPNGWVFIDTVVNYTRGFQYVWNEVTLRVTFESDWRAAKQMLERVAEQHANPLSADAERALRRAAQEYLIFYSSLTPAVYTLGREWGVELTLRYLVEPRRIRGSEHEIWEAILDAMADEPRVDFAYPTSRVVRAPEEAKSDLRPPDYVPSDRGDTDLPAR